MALDGRVLIAEAIVGNLIPHTWGNSVGSRRAATKNFTSPCSPDLSSYSSLCSMQVFSSVVPCISRLLTSVAPGQLLFFSLDLERDACPLGVNCWSMLGADVNHWCIVRNPEGISCDCTVLVAGSEQGCFCESIATSAFKTQIKTSEQPHQRICPLGGALDPRWFQHTYACLFQISKQAGFIKAKDKVNVKCMLGWGCTHI